MRSICVSSGGQSSRDWGRASEKRHGSKDSSHLSSSSRSHSSTAKGGHCGGYLSHRTSSHILSSKGGGGKQTSNMATGASPVKVGSSYSNDLKMANVEVSLKRLSPDVKTVSLHPDPVKSQLSPKTSIVSNLTVNSVSNGIVKSTTNGAITSLDSSPPPAVPSSGVMYCASITNSVSPLHNAAHKSLSSSPFSSQSSSLHKEAPGVGPPSSPSSQCSSPLDRTSEKSSSIKNTMTVCATKSPSSLSKNSSMSKTSMGKTKTSQSITKTSSNSSNKLSSSSKNSTSPLKCSTSPVKSSTSPARSAPSPAKSAPSPAKSASSPVKSPSKGSSPSQTSAGSTPNKSTKDPKERKFVLCKDREFDPNIHCGVLRTDDGRHCTRSLTCKTHALSLRRAVEGRRKKFDDLLKEHRAAKEAQLKAKSEGKAAASACNATVPGAISPLSITTDSSMLGVKTSHNTELNFNCSDDPFSISHKLSSPQSNSTSKFNKQALKQVNTNHPRLSLSGLQSPSWSPMEDMSPPDIVSRLSSDGEVDMEETEDRGDTSYITHHPIPIATCTFGGRCSSGGWYLFSRKTDYLRTAFLSALEKHLHPPPHKKLCVESKLPKEPQLSTNSMDPYEFNVVDMNASNLASHNAMMNSVHKAAVNKPKSKPPNSRTSKTKGDNTSPRLSQSGASNNNPSPTGSGTGIKRKRSSSGTSSPGSASSSVTSVSLQNAMIGGLSLATPNPSPIIAACVPNVNLSSNIGRISAASKAGQVTKNNIIKDGGGINLLVTNMEQSVVNGQYVNITGNMLEMGVAQDEKGGGSKKNRSGGGNPKQNSSRQVASNVEGLCSISNNVVANIAQKAIILDKSVLSMSPFQTSSVVPIANSAMSPPQASPSASASPFFRSGSVSPQVSAASPIPNGVISPPPVSLKAFAALNHMTAGQKTASPPTSRTSTPSPSPNFSAHESSPSHSTHFTFIGKSHSNSGSHKSHKSNSSHRSGSHPPSLSAAVTLGGSQQGGVLQPNHANSLHNFCVTNSQAVSGLGSLPLKPSGIKTYPLTMPFTVSSSVSHGLSGQQQPTATLFHVTSESMSKGELQLQQASTSHPNVIS
ncbi:uncharacterized protein LOC135470474 isoform X3 [Liolophura sinensis]|uniref:uncharacterized protein LOC135470474 isoform X3 n=1 Tax=Liolophura sinensis TaxID=3198878 RepID=UPI0031594234